MSQVEHSRIPVILAAAVTTIVATAVFLTPDPFLFPMDDTYIHVVYAENLANTGRLEFNVGEFSGIGSTSILWVLLLALLIKAGLTGVVATKVLSVLCLFLTIATASWLLREWIPRVAPNCPEWLYGFAVVAIPLSGNVIWFGLSGMETLCFLGFALWALVFYSRDNWVGVAIAAGLAALTRLEGGALLIALLVAHFATKPDLKAADVKGLIVPAIIVFALVFPWLAYLQAKTGEWLPTTFDGKRLVHAAATRAVLEDMGLPFLADLKPLVVIGIWVSYAALWVYGLGYGFPPSIQGMGGELGADALDLWLGGAVLMVLVVIPFTIAGWGAIWRARKRLAESPAGRALFAFILWALIHNAAYAFLFPSIGTSSRYQAVNHILLWMIPFLGIATLHREWVRGLAFFGLAILLAANLTHWRGTYGANLEHMRDVRFEAAQWIADMDPDERVAAFDIGALRWRSGRPLTDLGGLSNAEFTEYQLSGRVGEFLRKNDVTHLAIPCPHSRQSVMPFELMDFLRLRDDPLFRPVEVARFEGPMDEWRRGFAPTFNYQPSVVIYRIDWNEERLPGASSSEASQTEAAPGQS